MLHIRKPLRVVLTNLNSAPVWQVVLSLLGLQSLILLGVY